MQDVDPATIGEQGWVLLEQAFDDGDPTALADATDLLREAIARGPGHPDRPTWHHGLGLALATAADMTGALADWETALDELRRAAQAPHPDVEPDALAGATAYALVQRYVAAEDDGQGAVDDLVTALDALADPAGPAVPAVDLLRGRMRLLRFRLLGEPADQEEGLALLAAALPDVPEGMPRLADAWFDLAVYTADPKAPEIALAAVGRARELMDPDLECPDLDQLESDLLYSRWSSSDDLDLMDETIEQLERLCHAAATAPADALVNCGELRLWRGQAGDSITDLDAATRWLGQAESRVDGEDAAIVALLLGTAATQRARLTGRAADRDDALTHLGTALRRGLPVPEFAMEAHRQRLVVLLVDLNADRPTDQAIATAQDHLSEAIADLDGHPDADADARAELAISLARTELALVGLVDEPVRSHRVARLLDIAARHPAPPAAWQAAIGVHRSLLQNLSDTAGAADGDFGRSHTIAVLSDTELPESDNTPMRRMLALQSLAAGARTGDLGTLTSAGTILGSDVGESGEFMATLAEAMTVVVATDDDAAVLAALDRVIAAAPDPGTGRWEDRYVHEYLLPAFQALRAAATPSNGSLPELPGRTIGGPAMTGLAGMIDIARSSAELAATSDPHRQRQLLDDMTRSTRALGRGSPERSMGAHTLVCTWLDRAERSRDPHDAEQAIGWSTELLGFLGGPEHPLWAQSAMHIARAHRLRGAAGDHARSRELGQDLLRGHAWKVLLQSGTDHAITVARRASADAVRVARWCLHDRDSEGLVAALDAGRGLVLHAAVSTRGVVEQLRAAGEVELAREWAEAGGTDLIEVTGAPGIDLHGELRRRVLRAVGAGRSSLLDPPSIHRIRAALTACDADALVYLLGAGDGEPGLAVAVPAREPVEVIELPDLDTVAAAEQADQALPGGSRDIGPVDPDRRAGDPAGLPGWAWRIAGYELGAMAQRLRRSDGAPPRLLLVPFGALARVPWHAAGRLPELAVVSVIPSARLLCEATARPAWSGGAHLVVGNPTGDLPGAGAEARAVLGAFHPDATYLGRDDTRDTDGAGTAAELLERLGTGAPALSLLHLACHGHADPESPRRSHLRLADRTVGIDEVLALRPTAPLDVGTVCLAACSTNVSGTDYDEAFSLAAAFLAAGARTVFATMWPVPDDHTSRLMFMIHHYLSAEGCAPAVALHRARQWALDPDRVPPESMPASLRSGMDGAEDTLAWAGFQHLGA